MHPFSIRVNTRQASYSDIVVHDYISTNHAPAQFIPETLTVYAGYYNSSLSLTDESKITAGADYKIEWNSSYTDFKLTILNADTGHIIMHSVIGLIALIIMIIVLTVRVVKRNIT